MGGVHNQFQFIGDTLGTSYQHCAKWVPKTPGQTVPHLIVFDNGNHHATPESRAVEYAIDEVNKTATLVWQFRHTPASFANAMGSVQRMPNGNTFIGWGIDIVSPPGPSVGATEVTPNGDVVFEAILPQQVFSYRALKYPTASMAVAKASGPSGLSLVAIPATSGYDIAFSTKETGHASIVLVDLLGRTVSQIFDGVALAEGQQVHLATNALPSGLYFCMLKSGAASLVCPVVAIR